MKKIVKSLVLIAGLGVSFLSLQNAHARPYWVRAHDPKVNTWAERKYDSNHNGWVSPHERYVKNHARVNTFKEIYCDKNHNGYIGPIEARCL